MTIHSRPASFSNVPPFRTRRSFVGLCALGAAWLAVPMEGWAEPKEALALSLGFSLYGMKTLTIEAALNVCAQIGYRNVELSLIAGFPTEPKQLTPALRKTILRRLAATHLEVSSLLANYKLTGDATSHRLQLEEMRVAADFARQLIEAGHSPVIQTGVGGDPAEWETQKDILVERLRDYAAIAREYDVQIAVKAHVSSAVNAPDRLLWLIQQVGGTHLAVAYDHAHYALGGRPFEESLPPLVTHSRFVHVKEAEGDASQYRFLLPGDGSTNFKKLCRLLVAGGYRGPVVAEVSGQIFSLPGYDPVAAAKKCYAALAPAVAEAG